MPGRFVPHDQVYELSHDVDGVAGKLEALARAGEAERAVRLYEILLAGVYDKIEETDDECYLAMSFSSAFCGWIRARQAAGSPAPETLAHILKWMENDNYGFCYEIEKDVIKVLNAEGRRLFIGHFEGAVDKALASTPPGPSRAIFEYGNDLRRPALKLKQIYESLAEGTLFAALCGKLGFSPRDCERLAKLEMSKRHWPEALEWVEKGIALEPARNWRNETGDSLRRLKPEILSKLGRTEDALAGAWAEFQESPNEFAYERLMRQVPKADRPVWQERALTLAAAADLGGFVSVCVKARQWERLAHRVHSASLTELQALSHYCTEPAAKGLKKPDPLAAAKLYRALGMRILDAGKSKYYQAALEHFENARGLYLKAGLDHEWGALVQAVRTAHSRKSGFLKALEAIDSGICQRQPSFSERAQAQWKRLTS